MEKLRNFFNLTIVGDTFLLKTRKPNIVEGGREKSDYFGFETQNEQIKANHLRDFKDLLKYFAFICLLGFVLCFNPNQSEVPPPLQRCFVLDCGESVGCVKISRPLEKRS